MAEEEAAPKFVDAAGGKSAPRHHRHRPGRPERCVSFVGMINYFSYGDDYLTGDNGDSRKTVVAINEKYRFQ